MLAVGLPFVDLDDFVLDAIESVVMWLATTVLSGAIMIGDFVWVQMVIATDIDYLSALGAEYKAMTAIAAGLLLMAAIAGITAAGVSGKPGDGLRRLLVDGPIGIVVMATGLELAVIMLSAMAGLEQLVLSVGGDGVGPFSAMESLTEIEGDAGLVAAVPMLALSVAIVLLSILLGLFLMIRAGLLAIALIYIPFMAALMPSSYKTMLRLHVERLVQVALSKFVILVAMTAGAALMTQVMDVSDVYFVSPTPAEPNSGETGDGAAIGTILGTMFTGLGILVAASASPWFVLSQLPQAHHDNSPLSGGDGGGSIAQARGVAGPARDLGRRITRRK